MLGCDDTKLLPGLRLCYDRKTKLYSLVGGTGGPLSVMNPEEVNEIMTDPTIEKGTKVNNVSGSNDSPLHCPSMSLIEILFLLASALDWTHTSSQDAPFCPGCNPHTERSQGSSTSQASANCDSWAS